MRPKGQVSGGGGSFGCLRLSPLKWLEMHLKLTWYGESFSPGKGIFSVSSPWIA